MEKTQELIKLCKLGRKRKPLCLDSPSPHIKQATLLMGKKNPTRKKRWKRQLNYLNEREIGGRKGKVNKIPNPILITENQININPSKTEVST